MNTFDMAMILCAIGIVVMNSMASAHLTPEGKALPWYRRRIPIWRSDPYFDLKGQKMIMAARMLIVAVISLIIVEQFVL